MNKWITCAMRPIETWSRHVMSQLGKLLLGVKLRYWELHGVLHVLLGHKVRDWDNDG